MEVSQEGLNTKIKYLKRSRNFLFTLFFIALGLITWQHFSYGEIIKEYKEKDLDEKYLLNMYQKLGSFDNRQDPEDFKHDIQAMELRARLSELQRLIRELESNKAIELPKIKMNILNRMEAVTNEIYKIERKKKEEY
jgi:hypothetical protein